jgi:hypothetical protein
MVALADEMVRESQTPLQYVLGVMNNPAESKERRLTAASIAMPYVHPRYSSIEAKIEVAAKVRLSLEELAARAEREIDEAFREYVPPVIEHQSFDEPAKWPAPESQPVQAGPPRDYALEGPLEADRTVTRLPQRYRRPRPPSSGWSG